MIMCQFKAPHRKWLASPELIDYYSNTVFPEPETLFDDYASRGHAAKAQKMTLAKHFTDEDMKLVKTTYPIADPDYVKEEGKLGEKMYQDHLKYRKVFSKRQAGFDANKDDPKALLKWKYQIYMQDYLASIKGVDDQVGRLLDYLEKNGLSLIHI